MKIFPLLLLVLFLISCSPEKTEESTPALVCNPPYIPMTGFAKCCLDQDKNNLCDTTQNTVDSSTPSNQLTQQPNQNAPLPLNEQTPANLQFSSDPQTAPPVAQSAPVQAQPSQQTPPTPSRQASFFITSKGNGAQGGNYNGINGADAYCQSLGLAGKTWKAYLSTSTENAKDRIGNGPWHNLKGELIATTLAQLHNGIPSNLIYDEKGTSILNSDGSSAIKADHDVLTGSTSQGELQQGLPTNPNANNPTCNDWTDGSGTWMDTNFAYLGHADWSANDQEGIASWNSAHEAPCSEEGLKSTAGSGKLYCFAL
ncbi:MAG: hypothetical protein WC595_00455 [Candidatus Nanoarchaeia archaeon]